MKLEDMNLQFPEEPMRPIEKPAFKPGQPPELPHVHTLWGVHDPAIYHDEEDNQYYIYTTGGNSHRSSDLITWNIIGHVMDDPPKESTDWVGGNAIWAPDLIKVGSEYRMYGSNSTIGVRQSCIFLATSDKPEGPYHSKGVVLKTAYDSHCNSIDANIITEEGTGQQYMVYGSFWGGIHILRLNNETGFADEEGIGTCIARRPKFADCAIEGPYIRYNPDTGYYYLFVSYASLRSDYNIRVGRSRNLFGPYYDHNGRDMRDLEDYNNDLGYMVACGYQFSGGTSWMGPGHNSVLRDFDNQWYLVCHIRDEFFKTGTMSTMHVYKMVWSEDGWPMLNPSRYAGEKEQDFKPEYIPGSYEKIKLTPTIPQGIHKSTKWELMENGMLQSGCVMGHWELIDSSTICLSYGNIVEYCKLSVIWDWDLWKPTISFTGKDQMGICVWGKRIEE